MKLLPRILFCLLPAMLLTGPFMAVNPAVGLISFGAMFSLGWYATTARPERGEGHE